MSRERSSRQAKDFFMALYSCKYEAGFTKNFDAQAQE
jgi:hypothetical protein